MSAYNDPILSAALALSPEERAKLADYLLAKLHDESNVDVNPSEVEVRLEALRRGDSDLLLEQNAQ